MPLLPPPVDEEISTLADWFEIAAFSSSQARVPISEIKSQIQLQQDEEPLDWSEKDERIEDLQAKLNAKIRERIVALFGHYPFSFSSDGSYFQYTEPLSLGGAVYIFCLLISQANKSEVLSEDLLPKLTNRDRDLFQVCATLCAAGFCAGPAISFGWPRPDRSGLIPKLKEIEVALGARVRDRTLANVGTHVKDDEVDVIAWRSEPDRGVPSLYLLGQAASGRGWKSKSIRTAADHIFHQTWFEVHPPMPPIPAMFIPFAPDEADDAPFGFDENESADQWRNTLALGYIYGRYRVPKYAAAAEQLAAAGVSPIERLDDVPVLREWVIQAKARLQANV
jgi:hypothetical protein